MVFARGLTGEQHILGTVSQMLQPYMVENGEGFVRLLEALPYTGRKIVSRVFK